MARRSGNIKYLSKSLLQKITFYAIDLWDSASVSDGDMLGWDLLISHIVQRYGRYKTPQSANMYLSICIRELFPNFGIGTYKYLGT